MLRLYDTKLSGNAWKVRLLLRQLEIPFERVTLDLAKGDTNDPAFQAKSMFKRIPVLELEDGRTIVESGAILLWLARGTRFLPDDEFLRSKVTGWLFFEQGDLQRALALPRFWALRGITDQMASKITDFQDAAYPALAKMDANLSGRTFLVDERYSIADIALFPYVSMAPEGGYDLSRFPNIAAWIERVKAEPGWVPIIEDAKP